MKRKIFLLVLALLSVSFMLPIFVVYVSASSQKIAVSYNTGNYEIAYFPMQYLNITQGVNGSYSHKGTKALDLAGKDSEKDAVYAPFTGKIKRIYTDSGNFIWLESCNPVRYADGTVDYMTIMIGHDNDVSDLYVGKIINQGEQFYSEGTAGNATGNHIHLECGKGKFTSGGWYKNSDGEYTIYNSILPYDALVLKSDTIIKNSYGYNWRNTPDVIYTSNATIAARINQALALYGPGTYFSKNGSPCTVCNNSSSIDCLNNGTNCNCLRYVVINGTTVDLQAVQSKGYARYWQQMLFGVNETNTLSFLKITSPGNVSFTKLYVWLYNNQEALHPGTHLIVENGNTSIVLLDFELDTENATVTYIECNRDSMCGIEPITTLSFDDFCERFKTIDYAYIYGNYYSEYPENNVSCLHKYAQKTDATSHWIECTICNCQLNKTMHEMDHNIKYNSEIHWVECKMCSYKEEYAHNIIFCETENPFKHRLQCTNCGYDSGEEMHNIDPQIKYNSEICWVECKTCPYKEEDPHRFTLQPTNGGHSVECSFCDYQFLEPHTLTTNGSFEQHWDECACGYISNKSAHSFVGNSDSAQHWEVCSVCQYTTDKEMHNYVEKSDMYLTWQECTICGHRTENVPNHIDTETQPTYDTNGSDTSKSNETETRRPGNKADDKHFILGCNGTLGGSVLLVLALISSAGVIVSKKK